MQLLRFLTAGSVDDGKSTLIGRMLYDSKSLLKDQVEVLEDPNKRLPDGSPNFALLTDGLRAEREQGITIDVAYKYFNTKKRKFIIADTPGHVQYTRNMITGASNSDLAIILIDARQGVLEQTFRHSYIANLIHIPHLVVAINKMDLVDYSEEIYEKIKADYKAFAAKLDIQDITFIPVSAQLGDNVVNASENMDWYKGTTLLNHLETVHTESDLNLDDARLPVQYVVRPQSDSHPDYRGYAGKISSGIFELGDEITVLPSGLQSTIAGIDLYEDELEIAYAPQSVTIRLKDNIDVSRGDVIVKTNNQPTRLNEFDAWVNWMDSKTLQVGQKFLLRQGPKEVRAIIRDIEFKVDVNTFEEQETKQLEMNDIAKIKIKTSAPIFIDDYRRSKNTGNFILIDEGSYLTSAAGIIHLSKSLAEVANPNFKEGGGI